MFFCFQVKNHWKALKMNKKGWKHSKKFFDQFLGACCTLKLVKIHNISYTTTTTSHSLFPNTKPHGSLFDYEVNNLRKWIYIKIKLGQGRGQNMATFFKLHLRTNKLNLREKKYLRLLKFLNTFKFGSYILVPKWKKLFKRQKAPKGQYTKRCLLKPPRS